MSNVSDMILVVDVAKSCEAEDEIRRQMNSFGFEV